MKSCLSAPRSSALTPRNKVLCGDDPRQLQNSLVNNRPRWALVSFFSWYTRNLNWLSTDFICTQSGCLYVGQSVWSLPVGCVVLLPIMPEARHQFHSLGFRQTYLGHKTLSICSESEPWEVTRGWKKRERERDAPSQGLGWYTRSKGRWD